MFSEKDTPLALGGHRALFQGEANLGRTGKVNECYQARDHGVNDVVENFPDRPRPPSQNDPRSLRSVATRMVSVAKGQVTIRMRVPTLKPNRYALRLQLRSGKQSRLLKRSLVVH